MRRDRSSLVPLLTLKTEARSRDDQDDRWEVGGEFERAAVPVGATVPLPTPHRLFSLATHSVIAVWRSLDHSRARRLHVPDFFCPEVTTAWQEAGIALATFRDDPRWPEPDWSSLAPVGGDLVLAVDFFGARAGAPWIRWLRDHSGVLLIEDHSHDPVSTWARHSIADYAFASLRKTIPVSDGAILWSPRGLPLPDAPRGVDAGGSSLKLAAMVLKREYLAGGDIEPHVFRTLQLRGERELLSAPPSPMASWNVPFVQAGLSLRWRQRRRHNVCGLTRSLGAATVMRPMFEAWPLGHCPFNLILLFNDGASRDACRTSLIANRIFPPVHWLQPSSADGRVRDLGARILTIPIDHRYEPDDVKRVARVLLAFDAAWTGSG